MGKDFRFLLLSLLLIGCSSEKSTPPSQNPPSTAALSTASVPTLNNMGYMSPLSERMIFSLYISHIKRGDHVLDVGCAYGDSVIHAAQNGAFVDANDLSAEQLNILKKRVSETPNLNKQICYKPGDIRSLSLPPQTYDKILIASVLHFMPPQDIEAVLRNLHHALKPRGMVYILVTTPSLYVNNFANFKKAYEHNLKEKRPFPGYFEDVWPLIPPMKDAAPKTCHFMTKPELSTLLTQNGFEIVYTSHEPFSRQKTDLVIKGDEFLTIIAKRR